jgi:hypothetical protein
MFSRSGPLQTVPLPKLRDSVKKLMFRSALVLDFAFQIKINKENKGMKKVVLAI